MAINESRSMNAELRQGLADGTYKQRVKDRGGSLDQHTDRRYEWPENMRIEDQGSSSGIVPQFTKQRAGMYLEDMN